MKRDRLQGLGKMLIAAIALAVLFGACSKKEQASSGTDSSASGGQRVVRLASWWDDITIKPVDDYFKRALTPTTGIVVEFEVVPLTEMVPRMTSEIAAGDPPGIIVSNPDLVAAYMRNGLMLPLNKYMERDNVDFTRFYASPDWIIDGEMYGLPSWYGAWYFFVNTTLLEKAGIEVPRGSWTWDQLREYAIKTTDPANDVWGYVDGMNWDISYWYTLNGGAFSDDMTKCIINSPETAYAFDFLKRLIFQDKASPEISLYGTVSPESMFADGKAAFMYAGTWATGYIQQTADKDAFKWDIIFAPNGPGAKRDLTPARSSGYFIPVNTKDPEASWEVLKLWGSLDGVNNLDIGSMTGMPPDPVSLEAETYNRWPQMMPEHFNKDFLSQVASRAKYFPFYHHYFGENVQNAINSVHGILRENLDTQRTLDAAYNTIMSNWDTIEYVGKK